MGAGSAQMELHIAVFLFGVSGLFGKLVSASPGTIVFGRTAVAAITILIGLRICSLKLGVESKKSLMLMGLSLRF